ncbi:hypothetical protein PV325_007041, partial [Microctonus aethiopoides]
MVPQTTNTAKLYAPATRIDAGSHEGPLGVQEEEKKSKIEAPSVQIVDAIGEPLRDKYYEADSTIELLCVVRHMAMQMQYSVVQWLHGNRTLNYDTTRGGI